MLVSQEYPTRNSLHMLDFRFVNHANPYRFKDC